MAVADLIISLLKANQTVDGMCSGAETIRGLLVEICK